MTQAITDDLDTGRRPPSPAPLQFRLLGEFTVGQGGQPLPPPPHRAQALLAALLLRPHLRRRDRMAALLFPEAPERMGRQRLSHLLWQLRQWLPELPVETTAQEVYLPPETHWLDVHAFRRAAAGDDLPSWLEALTHYRGDLLEGHYSEWLLEEREALYLRYVRVSYQASVELLRVGRFQQLLPLAERLAQRESFDERVLRTLMRAYNAVGRRGAALAAYERFVNLAAQELGSKPEPATQALASAIRAGEPGATMGRASASPSDDSAEGLLRSAREALQRGDSAAVEGILRRLRADYPDSAEEVRLLEIDLALFSQQFDRAESLLEQYRNAFKVDQGPARRAAERLREAHVALGGHEATIALKAASEALVLSHQAGAPRVELEALLVVVEAQQEMGQSAQAVRSAERALTLARQTADHRGIARALAAKGLGQLRQGRYAQALPLFHEAHSVALERGLRPELASALRGLRLAQTHTNALSDALATVQEELAIYRDLGLDRSEAEALEGLAVIQNHLGRSAESLRSMRLAMDISRRMGDPVRVAISQYNMAFSLVYHDDTLARPAVEEGKRALASFRARGQPGWEASALTVVGYALWVGGQHRAALGFFRRAHAAKERVGELGYLPELLAYQGLAQLGLGQLAEALDLTRRAVLSLAQGEVSDEVVPEIYFSRASALSAADQEQQARVYFVQAYETLLAGAAPLADEEARQAFFHRNPTMRRLMQALRARDIAPALEAGVVSVRLPAVRGGLPLPVRWTVDAGPADVALKQAQGAIALRRTRLSRLLEEAKAQGATPTVAQLAGALGVSKRTLQRDLVALRHNQ